ncbi:hypothetical protein Fcan01_10790, partial [Folsomia candida]
IHRFQVPSPIPLFDLERIILLSIVHVFAAYFPLVLASNMLMHLDPLYPVVTDISSFLRLTFPAMMVLHVLRFIIVVINVFEICSIFSFVILFFLSGLHVMDKILSILVEQSKRIVLSRQKGDNMNKIEYLLRTHVHLQLAYKPIARYQELGTIALMLVGLLVFIFSNFATLRFYKLLPFMVFAFYPSVSAVVGVIVNLTLPYTHKLYEDSMEILRLLGAGCAVRLRGNNEVGDAACHPSKKKNKIAKTLANHSKAIQEIRDLLINPVKDGKPKSDDVVGDAMQNLLNLDKDITIQPEDGASQDLLEILNVSQLEPEFGPDLNGAVAESFTNLSKTALPKEKFDEIKNLFLTPQNCKQLGVPRVNPEIWGVLSPKIKQSDFQNQQMQNTLSSSTVALAKLSEIIMQNSKQMPTNVSQDILRLAIQAAALNSKLFQELNMKRKQEIRPCLNNDIAAVCNTPSTPELLFGDYICDTIKATKSAA